MTTSKQLFATYEKISAELKIFEEKYEKELQNYVCELEELSKLFSKRQFKNGKKVCKILQTFFPKTKINLKDKCTCGDQSVPHHHIKFTLTKEQLPQLHKLCKIKEDTFPDDMKKYKFVIYDNTIDLIYNNRVIDSFPFTHLELKKLSDKIINIYSKIENLIDVIDKMTADNLPKFHHRLTWA